MKHFYVYYSYEEYGRGYIGKRECKCLPEEDVSYFGSFKDKTFNPTQKIILETFESVEEALKVECVLHDFYEVDKNPHFVNKAKQSSSGFYYNRTGEKNPSIVGDNNPAKRPEVREILSNQKKGKNNPMYGLKGNKNPFAGKKHTKETKQKIGTLSKVRNSKNKWWVNPEGITKFQHECPGIEWRRGRVFINN